MVHDYQLFMVPRGVRERAPRARIQHFTHIPWPMPDYWRILPDDIRRAIHESLLNCDIVGLHTDRYVRAFLHCCNELTDGEVDFATGTVRFQGRDVQVRAYPISVDPAEFERLAASDEVREQEESVVQARPEKMILRVDRTDPSKNVVRGLRAYDLFLSQHPEWRGRVTMLALLDPSRPEIPEYAEYVGAIQRAVREVNDRWYMTGMWTPVDMRISDNFPQAVAAYKHYDVLLVNAIFDGMNLVAKEAPLVNQRDGVLILSENAGAHQELSPWALCVNPFDIQAQADTIYQALTMHATERHERIEGLRGQVREHDISRWIDAQLEDLAALRAVEA
jgi:trehalose 6-phosphate synthase